MVSKPVHVAAGVIVNTAGEILIARRPAHLHQGGLWEFPGGKLEAEEQVEVALKRELHEELGITVKALRPFIRVYHDYPDKSVLLDVWRVDDFAGVPHGREGQPVVWVSPAKLRDYAFPAANRPIVQAAVLPDTYLITPEPAEVSLFLSQLEASLARGVRLVQLRAHTIDDEAYQQLADRCLGLCHHHGARLLLNRDPVMLDRVNADGLHLTASRLSGYRQRPVAMDKLLGVSCHDEEQLAQASGIDADFAVVGPVEATTTHPGVTPLGWARFRELTDMACLPVYALGGMQVADLQQAWQQGAQGIAAISALWAADA